MKQRRSPGVKIILFVLFAGIVVLYLKAGAGGYLSFEGMKENRDALLQNVRSHHLIAALVFIAVYMSTAFFVPGAIALTLVAGFLFGFVEGAVYVDIAATVGATFAYLFSRYLIGRRIQEKFGRQLAGFNREIRHYGANYLFVLRIVPVMPFFLVNYLAGITAIPLRKFVCTTFAGMLPGSVVYAYAGEHLAEINSPEDLLSPGLAVAFGLLAVLALLPVLLRRWRKRGDHGA